MFSDLSILLCTMTAQAFGMTFTLEGNYFTYSLNGQWVARCPDIHTALTVAADNTLAMYN